MAKIGLWLNMRFVCCVFSGIIGMLSQRRFKKMSSNIRRKVVFWAWRDRCFPEPFSWFLHETGLQSLKITSARCFFIEMSKERIENSERTPPVSWRPWALAYSPDRPYNFHACQLQRCRKNAVLAVFFSQASGCHLARKSLSWTAMPVSNKKQEFEQPKRIKLFDDFWVRAYRFDFAPRRRSRALSMWTVDFLAFNFRHFGRTA